MPLPTATLQPATQTLPAPTATATALPYATVMIYYIGLGDNGVNGAPVGCGDSAIPQVYPVGFGQDSLTYAYDRLVRYREQTIGDSGLYNALYQSDLSLQSAQIEDGTAMIALEGTLMLGGECDNPRVKAQLEMIAGQFPGVTAVEITINGKPLDEALSLK
jgi:hypothetical protein